MVVESGKPPGPSNSKPHNDEPHEGTPLLATESVEAGQVSNVKLGKWGWSRQTYINIILVNLLLVSFGDQLCDYANVKVYESIICYRFYEKQNPDLIRIPRSRIGPGAIHGVDEMWCKAEPVAADLASLLGDQQFFDGIPNLLLSLPCGWAADRYGRRPFIFLGLLGISMRWAWMQLVAWNWQVFDIHWSWLSAVFLVPGGGSYFTSAILFVMFSDLTTPDDRAAVFFRAGAVNISANLLMPPLVAWFMDVSPWIPTFLGVSFTSISTLLCLFVPETLGYGSHSAERPLAQPVAFDEQLDTSHNKPRTGWKAKLRASLGTFTHDWRIAALSSSYLVFAPIQSGTQLTMQYISKRYSLRLSQATLILTIREAVHVVLFSIILPYVSILCLRIYNNNGAKRDLYLLRASQLLATIGWLMVGLSPNIPALIIGLSLAVLGMGASVLTKSFLTFLVPAHQVARVFAVTSIVSGCGQMMGAPLLALVFKKGMNIGENWTGLPFVVMGLSCGVLTFAFSYIRLREEEVKSVDVDSAEDDLRTQA